MNTLQARLFGSTILRAADDGGSPAPAAPLSVSDTAALLLESPGALDAPPEDDDAPEGSSADAGDPGEGEDAGGEAGEEHNQADPNAADGELEPGDPAIEGAEGEGEPAKPAIVAPHSWDAEAKAVFDTLTPEQQEIVARREKARDDATTKALEAATTARKRAETDASSLSAIKAELDQLLPKAKERFDQMWPKDIDWTAIAEEYGADQALKLRFQFDQDQAQLQQLSAAQQKADQEAFKTFVQTEFAKLPEVAPDLADPVKGPERRAGVARFMHTLGYSPEEIRGAGAREFGLLYDAMQFRAAKAALAGKGGKDPAPKPAGGAPAGGPQSRATAPAPRRQPVAPAAAASPRTSQQRAAAEAKGRHAKAPTVSNAADAILALGG